jgi:hypothetical protein
MRGLVDAGERVDGVLEQVVQHLAQHRRVGVDLRQVFGERGSIATPIDS